VDWRALIASQPALAVIPSKLCAVAEHIDIEAAETLFRLGDRPQGVFCVVVGGVRLVRRAQNEAEIVLLHSRGRFLRKQRTRKLQVIVNVGARYNASCDWFFLVGARCLPHFALLRLLLWQ
jgi:hypothetical protein